MIEFVVLDRAGEELGIIESPDDGEENLLGELIDSGYLDGTVNDFTLEYADIIRVLDVDTEKCVLMLEEPDDAEEDSDADTD